MGGQGKSATAAPHAVDEIEEYRFGPFRFCPKRSMFWRHSTKIRLGSRASALLEALVRRPHEIVSAPELFAAGWGNLFVSEKNLSVQIAALRRLLGEDATILTHPGRGYRFDADVAMTPESVGRLAQEKWRKLPPSLSRFHGREAEVAAIMGRIRKNPISWITGAGGIGKSRLAAEAAGRFAANSVGICFFDLTTAGPDLAAEVCGAFGLDGEDRNIERVADIISCRAGLLILDGAEARLAAVVEFAEQLAEAAPCLHILITSRDRTSVGKANHVQLTGLDVRGPAAVALFLDRAAAAGAPPIGTDQLAVVTEICEQLGGNPLSIELAAARLPVVGLKGVLDRLSDPLSLLVNGRRSVSERHRTIRATLDWTTQLLSEPERSALGRLGRLGRSVVTPEDAAAASVGSPELEGLVRKSAIEKLPGGRYSIGLATRHFAAEQAHDG